MTRFLTLRRLATSGLAAFALTLGATAVSAATYTYGLLDHPDRADTDNEYGLRLDQYSSFFSFGNGASATLAYNDVTKTAVISGTMRKNAAGVGNFEAGLWDVSYTMTGLTDLGGGFFKSEVGSGVGSGTISKDSTTYQMGQKAANGDYFIFNADGHRVSGDTAIVGRGWVNFEDGSGANDFLFLVDGSGVITDGGEVPLPAAGWLLIAGLGGLAALRRKQRKSA